MEMSEDHLGGPGLVCKQAHHDIESKWDVTRIFKISIKLKHICRTVDVSHIQIDKILIKASMCNFS